MVPLLLLPQAWMALALRTAEECPGAGRRRDELVGLVRGERLAGLPPHLGDEGRQLVAGGGDVPALRGLQRALHLLQLGVQAARDPLVLAVYSIRADSLAVGERECQDLTADGVNGQDRCENSIQYCLLRIAPPLHSAMIRLRRGTTSCVGRLHHPAGIPGTLPPQRPDYPPG